jgi:Vitamin B6 photo-protection and homoeostasis
MFVLRRYHTCAMAHRMLSSLPKEPLNIEECRMNGNGERTTYRLHTSAQSARLHWHRVADEHKDDRIDRNAMRNDDDIELSCWRRIASDFLPRDFPESVGRGYVEFHGWLFAQWLAQSVTYVLSTYALLSSVGVGASAALPMAAAVNWVLKDGLGCVGMIVAANRTGGSVDVNPKRKKWLTDVWFHVGVALELCLLALPKSQIVFIGVASLANGLKAMAGLIGGACRASINKSFARAENLGDITAKAQSQSTLAYLLGMSIGVPISQMIGDDHVAVAALFAALTAAALACSAKALRAAPLATLNPQRLAMLCRTYFGKHRRALSVDEVRRTERFARKPRIFEGERIADARVVVGASLERAFGSDEQALREALALHANDNYMLALDDAERSACIVLRRAYTQLDLAKAFAHCQLAAMNAHMSVADTHSLLQRHFDDFVGELASNEWHLDHILIHPKPSHSLFSMRS